MSQKLIKSHLWVVGQCLEPEVLEKVSNRPVAKGLTELSHKLGHHGRRGEEELCTKRGCETTFPLFSGLNVLSALCECPKYSSSKKWRWLLSALTDFSCKHIRS